MGPLGTTEILIILGVLVLLFGATRLPKAAEGIGKALKVFKKNVRESSEDDDKPEATAKSEPQAINQQAGNNGSAATASDVPQTHEKK